MPITIQLERQPLQHLSGAVLTLGRVVGNDIVVPDPRISSRHGRLVRRGDSYAYEDLGSRNGSIVEREGQRTVAAAHVAVPIGAGARLLLGDLVAPVVLTILDAPMVAQLSDGVTIVARRAMGGAAVPSPHGDDLRGLFNLLCGLSGRVEANEVVARVVQAAKVRFPKAEHIAVLQPDDEGEWCTIPGGIGEGTPSRSLIKQAVEAQELVAYVPEGEVLPSASVVGLAGAVVVPLLAGALPIGVLHISSRRQAFMGDALGWLQVAGAHLAASLVTARRLTALSQENDALRGEVRLPRPIVGESDALRRCLKVLRRVASTETTVLLLGETGTGKELAARYLHAHSKRADASFAPINCGALTEGLLSSQLFGHRRGAFTGAHADQKGLFQAAKGGTVFLDEIGEISTATQVRLLRVLQEREVRPVGAQRAEPIDVRVVAATNKDLKAEVAAGRFREDLYYRLAMFPIELPPLRTRHGDVMRLAERFRELACARHDRWVPGFAPDATEALVGYRWPGNVRELEHEVERAVILAEPGQPIGLEDLSGCLGGGPCVDERLVLPEGKLKVVMAALEERVVRRALEAHDDNRTKAATSLGISRQAIQAKLAKWRARDA